MANNNRCYVGVCQCGNVVAAIIDDPRASAHVAKHVAEWVREGLVVERRTNAQVRMQFASCACKEDK